MPSGLDDFRVQSLRLVVAAAQTANRDLSRKALAGGARVSGECLQDLAERGEDTHSG